MIGLIHNRPAATPLSEVISKSQAVNIEIEQGHFEQALELRGRSFMDALNLLKTLSRAEPRRRSASAGASPC